MAEKRSGFMLSNIDKDLRNNIFLIIDEVHREIRAKELHPSLYSSFLEHFVDLKNYTPSLIKKGFFDIQEAEKITKLEDFVFSGIDIGKIEPELFISSLQTFLDDIKKIAF